MNAMTVTTWEEAKAVFRHKSLHQALYDEGEVVMADVLVNLHGKEHRNRRRLENRLFRRDVFLHFQEVMFPPIVEETLKPHVARGQTELVDLGHQLMMNLAAVISGVDRPLGTPEETFRLYSYMREFVEGATLAHYTGDKAQKAQEVQAALEAWDREFLTPSIERRHALLQQAAVGEIAEDDLPKDVLTVLLANEDDLDLPHHVIRREIAFFLLAGAHTSATAFTRTMDHIFGWLEAHEDRRELLRTDRKLVQQCVHETIRLWPSSPIAMRRAPEPIELGKGGLRVESGDTITVDLMEVNRSRDVFGDDSNEFNPHRVTPDGVPPWGMSFGGGMHVCIGQDLASGVLPSNELGEAHLFGLVPVAVQALIEYGAKPHPTEDPEMDSTTARPYWGRYPVVFG